MKTSNIIILIILICLPVFSFTYNWLLKEKYLEGKFTIERFDPDEINTKRELPAFHHVVIDGVLNSNNKNIESIPLPIPWVIKSDENYQAAEIKFFTAWNDLIITRMENDTLFVSLEKEVVSGALLAQFSRFAREIEITLPSLYSLTVINGNTHFEGKNLTHAIKLIGKDGASIDVNSSQLTKLETLLWDTSAIEFEDNNQIDQLSYSLYDQAFLSISDHTRIKDLQPVHVDSLSRISITASAKVFQEQMTKLVGKDSE